MLIYTNSDIFLTSLLYETVVSLKEFDLSFSRTKGQRQYLFMVNNLLITGAIIVADGNEGWEGQLAVKFQCIEQQ